MERAMESMVGAHTTSEQKSQSSVGRLRAGWIISGLVSAFFLFDVAGKLAKPAPVIEAFARSGWPVELSVPLGVILLTCTVLYLIQRTCVLGAILLTGYLGGAVATNLRLENPLFTNTLFPVYFGVLIWLALWLREQRLRALFPLLNRG